MNYRRLRRDELEQLQAQFVTFLAAQSIPADDWVKIKVTDEVRADALVDQFSQMVYADVIARCEYVELRSKHQLFVFKCGPEEIGFRGLAAPEQSDVDFTSKTPPEALVKNATLSDSPLKVLSAARAYHPDRATEVFRMLEQGAQIAASAKLFDLIDALAVAQEKQASSANT